jgi:anhydro-N-acetylmuramic acid kinase
MNIFNVIGLMSGTSMDGVDLAYCRFELQEGRWKHFILKAATYEYPTEWQDRLNSLFKASAVDYAGTHAAYGKYLGNQIAAFMHEQEISEVDFVSSHGHTVFHQPAAGFTAQVGEGAAMAEASGLDVICDFRTSDVAYGGQGAPLVPIGDKHLFPEHAYCLNLGGIANVSFEMEGNRIAFDICPCNMLLNHYAFRAGQPFDRNGDMAASGKCHDDLLNELNALNYYKKSYPKSLGREEVEKYFFPVIEKYALTPADVLRTLCEHIAMQVAASLPGRQPEKRMLVSGGGAWNSFLAACIRKHAGLGVEIPDALTVNYKEALIFAFLGVLRFRGEPNCYGSVTGARKDAIGGAVYLA